MKNPNPHASLRLSIHAAAALLLLLLLLLPLFFSRCFFLLSVSCSGYLIVLQSPSRFLFPTIGSRVPLLWLIRFVFFLFSFLVIFFFSFAVCCLRLFRVMFMSQGLHDGAKTHQLPMLWRRVWQKKMINRYPRALASCLKKNTLSPHALASCLVLIGVDLNEDFFLVFSPFFPANSVFSVFSYRKIPKFRENTETHWTTLLVKIDPLYSKGCPVTVVRTCLARVHGWQKPGCAPKHIILPVCLHSHIRF